MKTYEEGYEDLRTRIEFLKDDLDSEYVHCESKIAIKKYLEELEDQLICLEYLEKQGKKFEDVWETL